VGVQAAGHRMVSGQSMTLGHSGICRQSVAFGRYFQAPPCHSLRPRQAPSVGFLILFQLGPYPLLGATLRIWIIRRWLLLPKPYEALERLWPPRRHDPGHSPFSLLQRDSAQLNQPLLIVAQYAGWPNELDTSSAPAVGIFVRLDQHPAGNIIG
jgi:hypothetical protein